MDASKFPFDEVGDPSGKASDESDAGSATGMFSTPPRQANSVPSVLDELKTDVSVSGPAPSPQSRGVTSDKPFLDRAFPADTSRSAKGDLDEFTRMYQSTPFAGTPPSAPAAPPRHSPESAAVVPSGEPPKKQPAADVTKIFSQLPTPRSAVPRAPVTVPAFPPGSPSASAPAGEFTQMFRHLDGQGEAARVTTRPESAPPDLPKTAAVVATPAASAEPQKEAGSFTQLFQSISGTPADAKPPAVVAPRSPAEPKVDPAPPPNPEAGSFTSLFQSIQSKAKPEPVFSSPINKNPRPVPPANFVAPPANSPASQGGFTQLFETLSEDRGQNQPFTAPTPNPGFEQPAREPALPPSPPMQAGPGEFTRLLQTLSDPSAPQEAVAAPVFPASASPAPPSAPPQVQGPGEYTRIISNAAFRDAQSRSAPSAPPAQSSPQASFPPLPQKPAFPSYPPPVAPPARPAMPAAPVFQAPPSAFPAPPPPAPAPPPAGKLQQYLPLLIVVNVFVLLVVVLIVIFVLRRH